MAKTAEFTAYCVKTKKKGVEVLNPTIKKTSRGGYMVVGEDKDGNKMSAMVSKEKAEAALKAKTAKKGF